MMQPPNLPLVSQSQFDSLLLKGVPILDVRAPVEFMEGSIPGSVNLPILDNEERAQVGTIYKQQGQAAAIELGHQLVSGPTRDSRISGWVEYIQKNPDTVVTCFRGGLRSKTAQQWLLEAGIERPRVDGGYKRLRQHCMLIIGQFVERQNLNVISGATGSGKTLLLRDLSNSRKILDLERWANHRGSAFGGYGDGQPTQIDFENQSAAEMLRSLYSADPRPTLIEDESRLVGRSVQPDSLFEKLRSSPIIMVEENLASRVDVTFNDYILNSKLNSQDEPAALEVINRYRNSLLRIAKKLGSLRTAEVSSILESAWTDQKSGRGLDSHRNWIEKLLDYYYDPMYLGSLKNRQPQVLFRGPRSACLDYLKSES